MLVGKYFGGRKMQQLNEAIHTAVTISAASGVLLAVIVRLIFGTEFMEVRDSGLIAGDGLYGFFSNLIRSMLM